MKYPNISVQFTGVDGNAFHLIGIVRKALKNNNVSSDEISTFTKEATSSDYDNLLVVCMNWVDVQ